MGPAKFKSIKDIAVVAPEQNGKHLYTFEFRVSPDGPKFGPTLELEISVNKTHEASLTDKEAITI